MMIILGDDEKFWVVTPAHATRLIKQGKIVNMELNAPFALVASRDNGSGAVKNGGALGTAHELLFESKKPVPALQQLLRKGQMIDLCPL